MSEETEATSWEELNDSTNSGPKDSKYYQKRGATLALPDGYEPSDMVDWRAGLFSVILPVVPVRDDFVFPDKWIDGRFKGVKTFEHYCDNPWHSHKEKKDSTSVFHQPAKVWFRPPLRWSVGNIGVDAVKNKAADEPLSEEAREQVITIAKRILFQPDLEAKNEPVASPMKYFLTDFKKVDDEQIYNRDATVSLLCAEFIQFNGPQVHPLEHPGGEIVSQKKKEAFIILHVAVENCSNKALNFVADSLVRESSPVYLKPFARDWTDDELKLIEKLERSEKYYRDDTYKISLLHFYYGCVVKALLANYPDGKGAIAESHLKDGKDLPYPDTMESGGYLKFSSGVRRPETTKPFSVSTLIPEKAAIQYPSNLQTYVKAGSTDWKPEHMWGWYLVNRYSKYNTVVPDLSEPCPSDCKVADYTDWVIVAAEQGIAVVRRHPIDYRNNLLWMLSSTRFVDLALLVRRSGNYLSALSTSLRNLRGGLLEILEDQNADLGDESSVEAANDAVSMSILKFQKLQTDLMLFRDHLWFEAVSGRTMETTMLRHYYRVTGVRTQYEDVSSEIELRRRVYESLSQSIRIQTDAKLADAESAKAKQEAQYATFLSVAAAALAVPGFIALFTEKQNWVILVWGLFFTAVVAFVLAMVHPENRSGLRKIAEQKIGRK